jgi:glutaredoxin 3
VTKLINDNKMVVFTKSYCPYSRALREMLDANGLKDRYGVFEIDREHHGNEVHKALKEMSGRQTIPNVYLNKENLGGDEEVEAMAKDGTLKAKLEAAGLKDTFF